MYSPTTPSSFSTNFGSRDERTARMLSERERHEDYLGRDRRAPRLQSGAQPCRFSKAELPAFRGRESLPG